MPFVSLVLPRSVQHRGVGLGKSHHDEEPDGGDELIAFERRIFEVVLAKNTLSGTKALIEIVLVVESGTSCSARTPGGHGYGRNGSQTCPGSFSTIAGWECFPVVSNCPIWGGTGYRQCRGATNLRLFVG
jgi:hypothetical protein